MPNKVEYQLYSDNGKKFLCEVEEDSGVCCRDDTMQGEYE